MERRQPGSQLTHTVLDALENTLHQDAMHWSVQAGLLQGLWFGSCV